jgi:hypothetical protein
MSLLKTPKNFFGNSTFFEKDAPIQSAELNIALA